MEKFLALWFKYSTMVIMLVWRKTRQMWGFIKRTMWKKEERHFVQINKEKTPIAASGNNPLSNEEELHFALLEQ